MMTLKKLMIATTALALGGSAFAVAQAQTTAPAQPQAAASTLSIEEAMDIATGKVPGGTVVSAYLEDDDDYGDRAVYEVELIDQDGEKEIYIDAVTGEIVGMEFDTDGDHDRD